MNLNKLNMENNTNIADILRDCPTGTKLYSPVFGNVTLAYVDVADRFPIGVKFDRDRMAGFLPDGRYVDVADAECCLFPSKEQRDWLKFKTQLMCPFKPFDRVVARSGEDIWDAEIFSRMVNKESKYLCVGGVYDECVPFNDHTARLVGTSDPYTEEGGTK